MATTNTAAAIVGQSFSPNPLLTDGDILTEATPSLLHAITTHLIQL